MLTYHYTARDPSTGQMIKADVEADSEQSAAKLLKQQGLVPLSITTGSTNPLEAITSNFLKRIPAKSRVLFSRQLSTLINAGLPLVQSLRNVNEQTDSKALKEIVNKVISDVEAGSTLSGAMAKYPKAFNKIYTSLVAAGEASGTLDKALERLAVQQEKDAELISKVRGAMTYPIIVILVMMGVIGFMMVKVMPQVKGLYEGMPGASLPFITTMLLAVSDFTVRFWWLILIVLGILTFLTTRWARTGPGKQVVDKLKMKMWPTGPLFMKMYMARFARTATTLVASGVPLIQVLQITAEAVNNVHLKASIDKAIEKIKGGKSLSSSIRGDQNFLPLLPNMLSIGEESGSMEQMLAKTADYYEKEVDDQIKAISTIIEPVLMVILGIVAFTIVAAVLLPIYGLAGQSFV